MKHDLSDVYEALIEHFTKELQKEEPDLLVLKEARELLKQMKYEVPIVPGSKMEAVERQLDYPKFAKES